MRVIFLLALAFSVAIAQNQTVAVLPTDGILQGEELDALTDRMREIALGILPSTSFSLLTHETIIKRLGGVKNYVKECKESSCIVDLGRKASADYVAQAQVSGLGDKLRIKADLYKVSDGVLLGTFTDYSSSDIDGLLSVLGEKAPDMFRKISAMPVQPVEGDKPVFYKNKWFWVAVGLDVAGAVFVYAGYDKNDAALKEFDRYNVSGQTPEYYKDAKEKVESNKSSRNAFYAVGGLLLASGIGVHIWF